ncbi:MAG: hypothetical protein EA362_06190 [Saprospirales bacterium]|nr:MAG: hypothetical protein EA362_06190 [Saprospirales bacterium]
MQEFLEREIFFLAGTDVQLGQLIYFIFLFFVLTSILLLSFRLGEKWFEQKGLQNWELKRPIKREVFYMWILALIWAFLHSFDLDVVLVPSEQINITIGLILQASIFIFSARILDKILNKILVDRYEENLKLSRDQRKPIGLKSKPDGGTRTLQRVVIAFVILILIQTFNLNFKLFEIPTGERAADIIFRISHLVIILLIFFVARLASWILTQFVLSQYYKSKELNPGLQFAINQILTYFIYVIAIFLIIEQLGIQFTLLLGGLAALLVGIGLGVQQTFNDLVSGIILLFERSIEVGDVIELDGIVGAVEKIGVRTSLIETRDNIMVIVPNSQLISDKVINWSHFDDKARFHIKVGVAYGSDTRLVEKILLAVAREHSMVLSTPSPTVQFRDFGGSSLDFMLFFWSREYILIEKVKSELRYEIDKEFRSNKVTIPFPQRDLWLRNPEDLK